MPKQVKVNLDTEEGLATRDTTIQPPVNAEWYDVRHEPHPSYDEATQALVTHAALVGDEFVYSYTVRPKTAQEFNAPILSQIAEKERSTLRALRDSARGNGNAPDPQGVTPRERLDTAEAEITALRGQLKL